MSFFKPQTAVIEQLNTTFQWESAVSSQHILLFPGSKVSDCQTVCACVYVKFKKKKNLSPLLLLMILVPNLSSWYSCFYLNNPAVCYFSSLCFWKNVVSIVPD